MVIRMATRSVIANRGRSAFLMLSLALSAFTLVVGASLVTSLRTNIITNLRDGFAGEIQGFASANRPLGFTSEVPVGFVPIRDAEDVVEILLRDQEVVSVAPRSNASAMVLGPERSAPAILVGIDSSAEADTLELLRPEVSDRSIPRRGVLLGRPMAERLRHDGTATILIPTADGLFDGDTFDVVGTYSPPGLPLIDEFVAFIDIEHLQFLLGEESQPSSLVVRLRDPLRTGVVCDRLQATLDDAGVPVSLSTWDELAGDLLGIARMGDIMMASGLAFLMFIVVLGVGNVCLVLMFEKTREIGLMRALGAPRSRVLATLLAELGATSSAAALAGVAAGSLLCGVLGRVGIPAASQAMSYAFGGDRLFPDLGWQEPLLGFVIVSLMGPLAALWPAMRSSAIDPSHAMRNSE